MAEYDIFSSVPQKLKAPSPLAKTSVAWRDPVATSADDDDKPTSTSIQPKDAEATSSISSSSLEGLSVI